MRGRRISLRPQKLGASAAIFFVGVVCYYLIYNTVFYPNIGDTVVILVLTVIYGLIPQRIVEHIPGLRKKISFKPA